MSGPVYDAETLKKEAEKASIMRKDESPIQAQIARIKTELEYMSMDIGALSEKTQPAQGRPGEEASDARSRGDEGDYDSRSPLQQQLASVCETISIHRSQIRRLLEVIEL